MWMIYGANGYTGQLTARLAVARGERPILAGRSEAKVRPLAESLGLGFRVFDLDDPARSAAALEGVQLVAHQAGPFSATSRPMLDACLKARCHYTDITGEVAVFEAVLARDAEAKAAGIVLMPGTGFDVVPTDCVAAALKRALPEATELDLAFAALGGLSPGTTKTAIEGLGEGGAARIGGRIRRVPIAWRTIEAPFPSKTRTCVSIPWGDISTAYRTTGIPNITTYMSMPRAQIGRMKWLGPLAPVLKTAAAQALLKGLAGSAIKGPDEATRFAGRSEVFGEARAPDGRTARATFVGQEGYTLTADASVRIVQRILKGEVPPGATTPGLAFGPEILDTLDGGRLTVQPTAL